MLRNNASSSSTFLKYFEIWIPCVLNGFTQYLWVTWYLPVHFFSWWMQISDKASNVHFAQNVSKSLSSWDKLSICCLPTFLLYIRRSHFSSKTFPTLQSSSPILVPWCSGYDYCTTSFNKVWTQVLGKFKSCSRCVGDSRWWGSLTMVLAGNKAKRLLLVNHATKTIHHLYHHQSLFNTIFIG